MGPQINLYKFVDCYIPPQRWGNETLVGCIYPSSCLVNHTTSQPYMYNENESQYQVRISNNEIESQDTFRNNWIQTIT